MHPDDTIPLGFCQCGCGERTRIAPRTHSRQGWVKGQPLRFLAGHRARTIRVFDPARSERAYVVCDCGYDSPCHVWRLTRSKRYGQVFVNGERTPAHVWFYERAHGPVPEGHVLHHRCENPPCVNADHLEPLRRPDHGRRHPAHWFPPLAGRWSKAHDACVDCGETTRRHRGHGRCSRCDKRERDRRRMAA